MTQTDDVIDDDLDLERVKLWTNIYFVRDGRSVTSDRRYPSRDEALSQAEVIMSLHPSIALLVDGKLFCFRWQVSHHMQIPVRE